MAMTKKERAAFEGIVNKLRIVAALRWTDHVEPDVPIPERGGVLAKGWFFNTYYGNAESACSSCVHHSIGRDDRTDSQGAIRLYSTKLRALKACRHRMELEFARKLAEIDRKIEAELKGGG